MRKKIILTENQIYTIFEKLTSELMTENQLRLLSEMAIPLKDYKKRVDGLRFEMVRNWCLCKYCQLYDKENPNFAHWITELKAIIENIKYLNIKKKPDKTKILSNMLIRDYDYCDINMLLSIIRGKFKQETIEDVERLNMICSEFSKNINQLISVLASLELTTEDYLKETFNI